MLVVDHCVRPSQIHGLGVFLLEPVVSGAVVWMYDPVFDTELPAALVAGFPAEEAEAVYRHAEYLQDREVFRLGNDADIFMNHSNRPTLVDLGDVMIASRDLCAGTELTCDYRVVHVMAYERDVSYGCAAE